MSFVMRENADGRGDNGWNPPEKTGSGLQDQAEGLAFLRRRTAGKLGVGGVGPEVGGLPCHSFCFPYKGACCRESGGRWT